MSINITNPIMINYDYYSEGIPTFRVYFGYGDLRFLYVSVLQHEYYSDFARDEWSVPMMF